jgi:hypothetical protein
LRKYKALALVAAALAAFGLAATTPASAVALPTNLVTARTAVQLGVDATLPAVPADSGDIHTDIIGGHKASRPYPGMASLQISIPGDPAHQDFHTCGAYLVSHLYAATNAHCVTVPPDATHPPTNTPLPAGFFHVRVGSPDRTTGGEVAQVTTILPHADWRWGALPGVPVSDIALLRLDHYVQVQPFEVLPKTRRGPVLEIGWGVTEPSGEGPLPVDLQELKTSLLPPTKCTGDDGPPITAGELCLNNPNGTDSSCSGDSGSPALQQIEDRFAVIGSASRHLAAQCGIGPTVYTDATYFRAWMFEVMRTGVVPPGTAVPPGLSARPLTPNGPRSRQWPGKAPISCITTAVTCPRPGA